MKSFEILSGRTQCVEWNVSISSRQSVQFGVPQGFVVGPVLFVIHSNGISRINCSKVFRFLYAGDSSSVPTGNTFNELDLNRTGIDGKVSIRTQHNCLSLNRDKPQNLIYLFLKFV